MSKFICLELVLSLIFVGSLCVDPLNNYSLENFQETIFKKIIKNYPKQNVVISPLSIHQIVSFAANGALATTQKQMVEALKSEGVIQLNNENLNLNSILQEEKKNLLISNAIFTRSAPKRDFLEVGITKYNATVDQLINTEQINNWCANKTNNKIKQIIDNVDNTIMILINAVYFKDKWVHQFQEYNTKKEPFNGKGLVDMMHQTYDWVLYYQNDEVQIIELPYQESSNSALIILPKEKFNGDLNAFSSNLSTQKIKNWLSKMKKENVKLSLPKFEIEFDITLNNVMEEMGMIDAFIPGKANFRNLCEEADLYLSLIKQKAYLKVDEYGTESAAVTIMTFDKCMMPAGKPIEMNVNRPFIFTIINKKVKDILLFMAKIEDIKSKN